MKSKLWSLLFWMIVAAAFIGPGTVTTAAAAGAGYGYSLLWALVFSVFACIILQESAARITIASELSLGEAIKDRFKSQKVALSIGVAIFLGCAAYEAGNILGAISGVALIFTGIQPSVFTLIIVGVSTLVLWSGKTQTVANIMGFVVAIMGVAFLISGLSTPINGADLLKGAFIPSLSEGSVLITLGLVGTTIVPYNIFMGSGLAKGQSLSFMRFGLVLAILIGGLISTAILLAGSSVVGEFSFENLAATLTKNNGVWMSYTFAIGLFAAGFTSSITAPLAAAITLKSVAKSEKGWEANGLKYRLAWGSVMLTGLVFGMTGVKPIPVIILAQAANGLILPVIAIFLWLICNNSNYLKVHRNGFGMNLAMLITVFVASVLGFINVFKAGYATVGSSFAFEDLNQMVILALSFLVTFLAGWKVMNERSLKVIK
ncbi:NRAMP family divalent metal transporter [Roseivirga seohaensis]|uniref:NRAMP family divalent metal transporter n=1 Tax=Roseivirga seohaensis TaxID=1914963 RepID=UPI0008F69208|nr:divalent metal cation transporter [Roseivirga seohaensis]